MLNIFEIPSAPGKKIFLTVSILFCVFISQAQNPILYGMTYGGGDNLVGTIFKMNADGNGFQTLYSFSSSTGKNPYGTLMQASDGKLYGLTSIGGAGSKGVLFRFDPVSLQYKDMVDFNSTNGAFPYGSLIQAADGKLYAMTHDGGTNSDGVIFSYSIADSTLTKVFDLVDSLGALPKGDLIQVSNGKFYGLTSSEGKYLYGTLFGFDPVTNIYSKYVDFDLAHGRFPYGSLTVGTGSLLYGTTRQGGSHNAGVLFRFNPVDSVYAILYQLAGGVEKSPGAGLVQANGKYYGMTAQGGADSVGTVYSFDLSGNAYSTVQDFDSANGQEPSFNNLMQASNGMLYGMTVFGGTNHDGVIFSIDPANGHYTKLHDFNGTDGQYPNGTLLEMVSPTAVATISDNQNLTIYPNPVQNELRINPARAGEELKIKTVNIYNLLGEMILPSQIVNLKPEIAIDVSSLPAGLYFAKISGEQGQRVVKFIKE